MKIKPVNSWKSSVGRKARSAHTADCSERLIGSSPLRLERLMFARASGNALAAGKSSPVTVGTIFEDSHIPLNKWLLAYHLLCDSKKGISTHQLHRMLGITYKSAWFMAHRIRYTMSQEPLSSKLSGIIEVDETYVGGKLRSDSHSTKPGQRPKDYLSPVSNKQAMVSVLQRDGRVQSRHVEHVIWKNLKPIIEQMVAEDAHLMTDNSSVLIEYERKTQAFPGEPQGQRLCAP